MLHWTLNLSLDALTCPASKEQAEQDALDDNTIWVAGLPLAGDQPGHGSVSVRKSVRSTIRILR